MADHKSHDFYEKMMKMETGGSGLNVGLPIKSEKKSSPGILVRRRRVDPLKTKVKSHGVSDDFQKNE